MIFVAFLLCHEVVLFNWNSSSSWVSLLWWFTRVALDPFLVSGISGVVEVKKRSSMSTEESEYKVTLLTMTT